MNLICPRCGSTDIIRRIKGNNCRACKLRFGLKPKGTTMDLKTELQKVANKLGVDESVADNFAERLTAEGYTLAKAEPEVKANELKSGPAKTGTK